jgi:hypothetical protein
MSELSQEEPTPPAHKSGHRELGAYLARELLALGDDGTPGQCTRVQFRLGLWPDDIPCGGMCESALADFFARLLDARLAISRARGDA